MDFCILGSLEVRDGDDAIALGGDKQRAFLALLLLRANEVVSSDRLIDELWAGRPPATAGKAVQVYVSRLRKALGRDVLRTRGRGYLLRVRPGELDLHRFQDLVERAREAGPAARSAALRQALALWRGPPLADLAYEPFAAAEIARLQELRLAAVEEHVDADLALGRQSELVAELEGLVAAHPLRERLRSQLMLALYRDGRQARALEVYQEGRQLLSETLGLAPSEQLRALERAILHHDQSLEPVALVPGGTPPVLAPRCILVVPTRPGALAALLALAEPLAAADPGRELMVASVVAENELAAATTELGRCRDELLARGLAARMACFSSPAPGDDFVRLAERHRVHLLLMDVGAFPLDGEAAAVLDRAPCDVALLLRRGGPPRPGPVIVPFGAGEHDWAALELAAQVSRATAAPLRLIGTGARPESGGRDASRLLADASLILQRTAGVVAAPLLSSPGHEGVMGLAEGAGLFIVGLSDRWRREGLGKARTEIARSPPAPTVFLRRGARPDGPGSVESRTRFSWSLTTAPAG